MNKTKPSNNWIVMTVYAFLASLGLNIDLSTDIPMNDFRIEGYRISRYQEVNGNLSSKIELIAKFFVGFTGNSVLWLCIFISMCMLFYRALAITNRCIRRYALATASVFSLLYVIGFSINRYSSLIALTGSVIGFLKCLIAYIGITLIFYALLVLLFDWVMTLNINAGKNDASNLLGNSRKSFFCRWMIILICWTPYLIVYFPGFLLADTRSQIAEALGHAPLVNSSPIFTTGLFGIFIRLGMLFRSANFGVFLYSMFQMNLAALAYSYVIQHMSKSGVHYYIRVFALIFFALYPVNAFYSISMWKDTLFGIVLMLITLKTLDIISNPDDFFASRKSVVVFSLLCVALFLIRLNGLHIILIFLFIMLLWLRKFWKGILPVLCLCAMTLIVTQAVETALNVENITGASVLPLPAQQIARTVSEHSDELSDEDRELISQIFPYEKLPELYDPTLSDPIMLEFNQGAFSAAKGDYIRLFIRLSLQYPLTCIESFLCHTHGYWYPDIDNWVVARVVADNQYGIHFEHIVPSFVDNLFSGIFVFRVFPAISMSISIGFIVWMTIVLALILIQKKQYEWLLSFVPVLLLWLTCIASPVSGQFRYSYGIFLTLPLFIAVALHSENRSPSR